MEPKSFWDKNTIGSVLAILIVVALILSGVLLFTTILPKDNIQLFNTWLIAILALANIVYNFFFGSSLSSAKKDKTISDMAALPAPPEAPSSAAPTPSAG